MSIREELALYKGGRLSETERKRVEEAIDSHEALDEFLMERDMASESLAGPEEKGCSEECFTAGRTEDPRPFERALSARIRASFIRAGVITALAVLVFQSLCALLMPRLADAFYYDPLDKAEAGACQDAPNALSADLAAFTELFRPDFYRKYAAAERLGYGSYMLCIYDLDEAVPNRTIGVLRKNTLLLFDGTVLCPFPARIIGEPVKGKELEAERTYRLYISLQETDYASIYDLWKKEGFSAEGLWVSVLGTGFSGHIGFFAADPEGTLLDPDQALLHFDGLVTYLAKREGFLQLTSVSPERLETVQGGSLHLKGIMAEMTGSELSRLCQYSQILTGGILVLP